ncbi:hypothetical protein [Heyndrickxia vini]|uniref:Uncharacterized protein n=1 Tax=Heyndrickxia vini TaxID=1476025 RepID=A0ABX7E1A7_9BACI|nr:hypothetical protein [Heyndrickxia vini]QQZ09019.1 hypothetical protein I5776_18840 [Heyndrickxia vini]
MTVPEINVKEKEESMAIKYQQCPKYGSKNTMKILYGMPTQEAFHKAEAGEIKLGGCCIIVGGPEYSCKDCEHEWNKEEALEASYDKIKGLKASVGGYFEGYYNIEVNLSPLLVSWSHWVGGGEESIQKTLYPTTAKKFIEELKIVNLLNWKAKYIEPGVLDGTLWSVEIIREGRNISKQGDNKFPDEWDAFCKLIRKITGKNFS